LSVGIRGSRTALELKYLVKRLSIDVDGEH
jgi:hypothetical protein